MRFAPFALSFFTCTSAALAGEVVKVELVARAQDGQGQPELVVRALDALKTLSLEVRRASDGEMIRHRAGATSRGETHRFALSMRQPGETTFNGTLEVVAENGESGSMPISVKTELLPPLRLEIAASDVDLAKRSLRLRANRAVQKVQVSLMSDAGTPLGTTELEADAPDGDDGILAQWTQSEGTVLRMSVKAWDAHGFFAGIDLFPWRVDIPHEEVNFRSGKWDIDESEVGRLGSSLGLVRTAIEKYGKLATIRLFIAGHTDTVGDPRANRSLSENRARAIGAWFKARGVAIPISTAGFGEDHLAVETPDETDERRNRRAEYIVSVDAPTIAGSRASWQPL